MDRSLTADFSQPSALYRGKPFWAWNGKLDPQELRRQIRIMHRMGLGGFFMHSRVGLDTPYLSDEWFDCVNACIDEAGRLDMEAWLYDEDRWPSGAAGGLVTKNPKYRMRSLLMCQLDKSAELVWDSNVLAAFVASVEGSTATGLKRIAKGKRPAKLARGESILAFRVKVNDLSSWVNGYTYLDTMNHEAVREFIRITHEAYAKHCGKHFGGVVPGIFTDEPNYGSFFEPGAAFDIPGALMGAPWTAQLPGVFKKRYGYDILAHLPEVFMDVDGQAVTPARWQYFDCITHLFVDAFSRQVGQWCQKHNLPHTGHLLSEATLSSQTSVVGSTMRFYEHMQAPGMDILGEGRREYDTAKQVSSAARQFGRKWRLTETYGCTGWQFPLRGHKAIGDWQVALGINLRCQHLSWYTMEGQAKRDYPAGIFYHSPWWELYSKVEDYFARVHAVMTRGEEVRDLLVIHPVESMWVRCHKGWRGDESVKALDRMLVDLRDSLLAANIDFDYGDEDILARHGKVAGKGRQPVLKVAQATYTTVLVPPLVTIRKSTVKLLKRFAAAGGKVVFAGDVAEYVDAVASDAARKLADKCDKAPAKGKALVAAVENARRLDITDADGRQIGPALHLLREDDRACYLFVCNTGHNFADGSLGVVGDRPVRLRKTAFDDVRIRGFAGCKGRPVEMDTETGDIVAARARRSGDGWEIRTSLAPVGSRLFVVEKRSSAAKAPRRKSLKTIRTRALGRGPWRIALSECNNLVLDRPRFRIGSGQWRKADEILRVDYAVRDALGVARRGGTMVQPWAREKTKNPKRVTVALAYDFRVEAVPSGELFLAIERPETFRVELNGSSVGMDTACGWWVDRSLLRIPLDSALLRRGDNTLTLTCDYDQDHPGLEAVHLLGSFGVAVKGTDVSMTACPESLKLGDWVRQGLAFYSGSVSYVKTIRPKLSAGRRLVVSVPAYEGAAVRVLVDGRQAGVIAWEPNEVDITDFVTSGKSSDLQIQVVAHRRNSHGPLHLADKRPGWTGPGQFVSTGANWQDDYQLVPCGLTAEPLLVTRG